MPATDPVPPQDDRPRPASRAAWRRPANIAWAVTAVACLVIVFAANHPMSHAASRPRASAAPTAAATPSAPARWTYDTSNSDTSPAVAGGTVYIGSSDGTVTALNAATGRLRWTYITEGEVVSHPVVASGTVYVGLGGVGLSGSGGVDALDAATGRLRWTYATSESANTPAVAGGTVYVSDVAGEVYALDATTGRLNWPHIPTEAAGSSLAAAGGTVYIGSDDGTVYALAA